MAEGHNKTYPPEIRAKARLMFISERRSQKYIAETLEIELKTLKYWCTREKWALFSKIKAKRAEAILLECTTDMEFYSKANEIAKGMLDDNKKDPKLFKMVVETYLMCEKRMKEMALIEIDN